MHRIDIISVQPRLMESPLNHSIVQRAKDKGIVEIVLHDLKDYGLGKYKQVDDTVYGGGAGMVIRCEPVFDCIEKLQNERTYDEIIYMCPDGVVYNQSEANQLSLKKNIIILCGHYKGIDQRIRDEIITKEISIGDYVLSGGELAAVVVADSICRLIPGVISDEESALTDSFQDGLLAPPVYTRPAEYRGLQVPDVLKNGHFAKIAEWREEQALKITQERRPDLLE
ncbi:tRNA (guanosine(37)-N1)-methyltransferase TrmD [Bacteroidia bacterium]|jgi:tRNA (guanine37-N1)-methyltransferase|nr:tRNA (guanosine(37)-N1)-methyltransferase TrmD [Bacteroidota bacterium]MDB4174624.1 tRNA (guanosine(37)-N1)-methyltransferase TrmD [Bacteroidia bacterium]